MKNLKLKSGFTLIELLIVIAILGILAIGLIAALDPIEQLKRARDTSTRTAVEEFFNAAVRYYAVKEEFPWGSSSLTTQSLVNLTDTYIQSLVEAGELKSRFSDDTTALGRILVTSTNEDFLGNMDDLAVCFAPESKAVRTEENSDHNGAGVKLTGCPTSDYSAQTCFWCVK